MKRALITVLVIAMSVLSGGVAFAQNPHFIGEPELTQDNGSLTASGSVAGLGNEDILVVLDATGIAQVECENPGGNRAPGQDTEVDVSGETIVPASKNGRVNFSVTAGEPGELDSAEVCPNPKWTAHIVGVEFTDAELRIFQPVGDDEPVLTYDFDLNQ